ncbi:malonate decarboxylase subunit epsilon [Thauera butanivorans]|uniref:malonate decarboxylase subunit epsilon n=1 Tax=Thauera butanivorans TaxID=86174 RepID=UPI000837FBD6|nr:malonate decarboxylase subunit epsilon [Thauera butanivorans]
MSVLFTFPGQGSQSPGMLSRLPADVEVERTFAQAHAVLGRDPGELDTEASLRSTVAVQLALLIAGVAMARVLIARGARPDMVAGMSVGAYPAAVVAGVLDYEDALRLVALRGRLMEEAFPASYGMTAVIGIELSYLERIVARIHSPSQPVFIANLNAERQTIVAGADAAMEAVAGAALEQGATRCERLAASVPSHCELLAPVAHAMKNAFAGVATKRPRIHFLSSSAARVLRDPARIADDLAGNVAMQVNWLDTAKLAWERGARLAVEMPSREVLTGLTHAAFAEGLALCCENNRVDTVCALIRREQEGRTR